MSTFKMYQFSNSTFKYLLNVSPLTSSSISRFISTFHCLDSYLFFKAASQKRSQIITTSQPTNESVTSCERTSFSFHGKRHLATLGHGKQDKNVQELVKEILTATRKVDVMTDSLHVSDVEDLVTKLHHQGFEAKIIQRLLSRRLWLLEQIDETANLTQLLVLQGFSHSSVCLLIEAIPYSLQNLLHQLPSRINDMMMFFGNQGISGEDLLSTLQTSPQILYLDLKMVEKSVFSLKSIFSNKDVKKVLRKSPSLLSDPWPEVYHKYQYAVFNMVYSNHDIINSRLFSHSFQHIKNRHLFLERAGLFVAVSHKLDATLNPNPRLREVVDTSTLTFLKLFPVASPEEYSTYCEMRAIEEEMDEENVEYSDGDWEVDSDLSGSESEKENLKRHLNAKTSQKKCFKGSKAKHKFR